MHTQKAPAIINIYNFVRKSIYPDGRFMQGDFQTVLEQLETCKQYGLPVTFALKYDALVDPHYQTLLKERLVDGDEIGVWWEIDRTLCEAAGVRWKGGGEYSLHVRVAQSIGYTPEDRIKMIDVYMRDFKAIFGYYPTSVSSFVMDIISYTHFKERYGVVAAGLCRDQIGVDGFTLWGGYFGQAYYPSRQNEYMPAQTQEAGLDLPIFRLLGPCPLYNFEDGLRPGCRGVFTMEPVAQYGQQETTVDWYLRLLTRQPTLGFSYLQAGQENTYLWDLMRTGYELQISKIAALAASGAARVETLSETGRWYASKYRLTPPTTIAAPCDWNLENGLKTLWYESRFYRTSFLWDQRVFSIRDLFVFHEDYASRYLEGSFDGDESVFDTLPVVNAHYWKTEQTPRPNITLVGRDNLQPLQVSDPVFETVSEGEYHVSFAVEGGAFLHILCREDGMRFRMEGAQPGWLLYWNTLPVLEALHPDRLDCRHEGFAYSVFADQGVFARAAGGAVTAAPQNHEILLRFTECRPEKPDAFLSEAYRAAPAPIDGYTPAYLRAPAAPRCEPLAFQPVVTPEILLTKPGESAVFTLENPNPCGEIRYTTDGSIPDENAALYTGPVSLSQAGTLQAVCIVPGRRPSRVTRAVLYQSYPFAGIRSETAFPANPAYNRNGARDLIDGRKGSTDYACGAWLGCLTNLEATADLGETRMLHTASIGCLQATRQWIFFPQYAEFAVSEDGEAFTPVGRADIVQTDPISEISVQQLQVEFTPVKARYLRVFVQGNDANPPWSHVAGLSPSFMFLDQITAE